MLGCSTNSFHVDLYGFLWALRALFSKFRIMFPRGLLTPTETRGLAASLPDGSQSPLNKPAVEVRVAVIGDNFFILPRDHLQGSFHKPGVLFDSVIFRIETSYFLQGEVLFIYTTTPCRT